MFGFTSIMNDNAELQMCFLQKATDSMQPGKIKQLLETTHSEYVGRIQEFIQIKILQ